MQQLALCFPVGFPTPEDRKVVEHLAGLIEVGQRCGCERVELRVDRVAASEVTVVFESKASPGAKYLAITIDQPATDSCLVSVSPEGINETGKELLSEFLGRVDAQPWCDSLQANLLRHRLVVPPGPENLDRWTFARDLITNGLNSEMAYARVASIYGYLQVLDTWSQGYFRMPLVSPAMDFTGAGVPSTRFSVPTETLTNG